MNPKSKKQKEIIFSEKIDSRIDGLTLGWAFIVVGLFLLLVPDYFGNKLAGQIVRWIFIVVGTLGLFVEFGKIKPVSDIKGFDDLWVGILLIAAWAALFFLLQNSLWNIIGFFFLVFGLYGASRGLLRIIYSIHLNRMHKSQSKGSVVSDVIIFLTKVISLAVVVLQFVKVIR